MSQIKQWGATPEEWFHFDLVLGRTHDLLPVVCNPDAPLSPDSKLKALGKTPSHYNGNRLVVGLANWTKREISDANIERWSQESDYGICSRMGKGWLALDCDSESPDIQDAVRTLLLTHFGELPPRRYRMNSNKCLYLLAIQFENDVTRLVKVPLTQGQFDALVSFAFNLGSRALSGSTLLRKLNDKDYAGAAAQFTRWVYANNQVLAGLVRRREAEKRLFES